jgi:transposase
MENQTPIVAPKKEQIKVTKGSFTAAVNEGLTKEEIAARFGISKMAVAKFAKDLNLRVTIKRKGSSKYLLIDDADAVEEVELPTSDNTLSDVAAESIESSNF